MLFLREFQIGFGRGDVGRALLDDRLLQFDLGVEVAHRGFRRRDVGAGLVERGLEIAVVDLASSWPALTVSLSPTSTLAM